MPEETSTASGSGSAEERPCSSSGAANDSLDVMEEAKKLIGTGKRHLVMGDVVSAVGVFQDACGMLAARFGDTADECGEVFFLCGKSLLELARMENGVLGNALEGVPEESEDDEQPSNSNIERADDLDEKTREELRKQVYDAMAEEEKKDTAESEVGLNDSTPAAEVESEAQDCLTGSEQSGLPVAEKGSVQNAEATGSAPAQSVEKVCDGEDVKEEMDGSREQEGAGCSPEDDTDEDEDSDEDGEKNSQDNEDEVGNLQLAWEMLEVAKVIFKRKESKDDQLMAAQAYLKLGEVSAESGNYPQALEDYQECLALQLKHLPPHSRLLAETHYHVALTLCYMNQYSQAIQHYNSSIEVIENRLAMLQEAIDAAEGTDGAADDKNEMEELKRLLPEIRERVEDAKESQKTACAASQEIQQTIGSASSSSRCENGGPSSSSSGFATSSQFSAEACEGSSSKAACDISHLVRKKRKPEEQSPVKDTDAKQLKQEATVNGSDSKEIHEGESQEPAAQSASESS